MFSRKEDLSELLSAEAVESVAAEADGTAMNRRARDADELFGSIRSHGALAPAALEDRVRGDWRAMLAALEANGRVIRARLAPDAASLCF